MNSLDLFSTSQTKRRSNKSSRGKNDKHVYDACANNAPCFAYEITKKTYGVVQGCCNDWNCPRCGQQRAREEYGRIVEGARKISKTHQLYFLTITCRGKEIDHATAERFYLEWTNRFLTRIRTSYKRAGCEWYYASVTERQKRQHPHSHLITTYHPDDGILVKKGEGKYFYTTGETFTATHDTIQSRVVECAATESGLGNQYDISRVESVEAGSRYMAKYLFKESIFSTIWPKNWRRVRYSKNWPKLDDKAGTAFILLSAADWFRLGNAALIVRTQNDGVKEIVRSNLYHADVIIQ